LVNFRISLLHPSKRSLPNFEKKEENNFFSFPENWLFLISVSF